MNIIQVGNIMVWLLLSALLGHLPGYLGCQFLYNSNTNDLINQQPTKP